MPDATENTPENKNACGLPLFDLTGADKITLLLAESFAAFDAEQKNLRKKRLPPPPKKYKRTKGNGHSHYKTKGWSDERRQKQRQRLMESRPWEKSTGPRTAEGREKSKINRLKHGRRSAAMKDLLAALQIQKRFVRALNTQLGLAHQDFFRL